MGPNANMHMLCGCKLGSEVAVRCLVFSTCFEGLVPSVYTSDN